MTQESSISMLKGVSSIFNKSEGWNNRNGWKILEKLINGVVGIRTGWSDFFPKINNRGYDYSHIKISLPEHFYDVIIFISLFLE